MMMKGMKSWADMTICAMEMLMLYSCFSPRHTAPFVDVFYIWLPAQQSVHKLRDSMSSLFAATMVNPRRFPDSRPLRALTTRRERMLLGYKFFPFPNLCDFGGWIYTSR
ncbi:hypothetical protein QG37_03022 [Candidozyma auris]|nr:hypothetical protein QG37_03022 [[Candida] auris]